MKTDAIILHQTNLSSNSRVVDVLSPELGRLKLIAHGARASKRRFAGALDLFVSVRAVILPRGKLWTLQAIDPYALRLGIRTSIEAFERANRLLDCCRTLCPEAHAMPLCFHALEQGLNALDVGDINDAALVYGSFLQEAGICPDGDYCDHCRSPMTTRLNVDPHSGQLHCSACDSKGNEFHRDIAQALHVNKIGRQRSALTTQQSNALERLALHLIEIHHGRPLKSRPREHM